MRPGFLAATVALVSAVGISTWLAAAEYPAIPPDGDFSGRVRPPLILSGRDARELRRDALRRATYIVPASFVDPGFPSTQRLRSPVPSCRYLPSDPTGTTPKFDCVFAGGDTVKVKYGRNAEIHGEAAATALLRMLGYAADTVTIVQRLRCYGCPRHPFVAMHLRRTLHLPFIREQVADGFTDFEWVSVEHKFPAPAIETGDLSGWDWRELDMVDAPRDELDAFRLIAAFLAHWDNKASNQRLVCLDEGVHDGICRHPLAMIQDLGASFGPPKVNLARWRDLPVWHDRTTCTISMRALPYDGSTFEDVRISEAGRALAASRLGSISDVQIERLFADARFPQFQAGTDDERDLKAWTDAFRDRVRQVAEASCPGQNSQLPTPNSQLPIVGNPPPWELEVGSWEFSRSVSAARGASPSHPSRRSSSGS